MEEQQTRRDGQHQAMCKACGSRPTAPATDGTILCGHCAAALELPDTSGLVEDQGAAARRAFENRDMRSDR
ncbi:hypothetical protein ACIF8T_40220 [Streptomyces sp. NPDC085946]|uniref:hypothetical protein n=1 Tax=Streptomyces sp. NPDC085946 TaxID=3365744 RepID=UPI0037D1A948